MGVTRYGNSHVDTTALERFTGSYHEGKPVYRMRVSLGALPNTGLKVVAHGIVNLNEVVEIDGTARDTATGDTIPLEG